MLETEIKNNTAALTALAAAIGALAAALRVQNPAASAPASMPPVNPVPAAAAPVVAPAAPVTPAPAPAPASMPPVNPVPAAAAPVAPAPASMPPVNPVPAAAAPAAPAISGDDLRKLCVKAGAAGLTAEVVQFLSDHGVAKLAALPPADYPALVALLKSKGVE